MIVENNQAGSTGSIFESNGDISREHRSLPFASW